jgi:aspartyl-tRNA(Asn)/glutamyl-tRNA(Gln) amidotransferase subunit A
VLSAIAGYDPADPVSIDVPAPDFAGGIDEGIDGIRIGVLGSEAFDGVDPEIVAAVRAAAERLAGLGADVVEHAPVGLETSYEYAVTMIRSEALSRHRERMRTQPEVFGEDVLRRLRTAELVTGADYAEARELARAWTRTVDRCFERVDVLLSATTPDVAPRAEGAEMIETTTRLTRLTYGWSLADLPAISIPCGFTAGGLPVGLQLAAARWHEALLLRLAHAYQGATDWHTRRPDLS